jgi:HD-like signal output (HDOD) protein
MEMEIPLSIKNLIEKELERNDLKLPFPDTMASILNTILGNEYLSVSDLANIVGLDASLTTRILNLSNSVFYSGLEKTRTVDQAIARIGLGPIRNVLTASLMKEAFVSVSGSCADFFLTNWRHSLGCAVAAKRIAKKTKFKSLGEDAYLLGLVHDVGNMFIMSVIERFKKSWENNQGVTENLIREILDAYHPTVGAKIIEKFGFETQYCRIVATHHEPALFEEQEDPLFNILQVADSIMRKVGISINPNKDISIISLPSTAKLGLEPSFITMIEDNIEEMLAAMDNLI